MTLAPGAKLGPYEILEQIGAGGMGEVYRAKDPRLGREVAIKVLPAFFDPERLRRFEREAQAAGALNHPNITAVYDIGTQEGAPYVVMELLRGETLRERILSGPIPARKAIDYAIQIARGLAAAHEANIIHRDLKPENLFLTTDGRVKILDFGLAKLTHNDRESLLTQGDTMTQTEPGVVLGTLGYMSPEQVKGQPADARSDIFSLGAVFYEMLSGKRAFKGDSAAETMSAILKEDPPELSATNKNVAPGLERVLRRCLEKNPEERIHSAHDLAFQLEALSTVSRSAQPAQDSRRSRRRLWLVAGLAAALAAAPFLSRRLMVSASRPSAPSFDQVTFRVQKVFNARFAPDGKAIVFSAATRAHVPALYITHPDVPDPRSISGPGIHLLSVSSRGELAVLTNAQFLVFNLFVGTLARMPLEGGAPREIVENVREADWSPDGAELALIREIQGSDRLEFPPGKVLGETRGYFSDLRFSPKGDRIAFVEHPIKSDDRGHPAVVDLQGRKTALTPDHWAVGSLSWSRDGKEVLFSAGRAYHAVKIHAVSLAGTQRVALEGPGSLAIRDVREDGRWLVELGEVRRSMMVSLNGSEERDLSWLDLSDAPVVSRDGKTLLFTEQNGNLGANYAVCLRGTEGSPVVRLGEGHGLDLSPDGKWVLAILQTPQQLVLYPAGAGPTIRLDRGPIDNYSIFGRFFPDGKSVIFCGTESGHDSRCYAQDVWGGKPRALTPEGTSSGHVSPDGAQVLVSEVGRGLVLYPAGGGEGRPVPGTTNDDVVVRWGHDGGSVLAFKWGEIPARIERLNIPTGRREFVRRVGQPDTRGVIDMGRRGSLYLSEDEKSYAYVYRMTTSQLFLVQGAR